MHLIFATSSEHKIREVQSICPPDWKIISMKEAGFTGILPETSDSLEGNSLQKAETLGVKMGMACFAEDTGLEIDALQGAPGVHTARFAGEHCSAEDNWRKVLLLLEGEKNRNARFRTIITHYHHNQYRQFEGICEGEISLRPSGADGFGYDPVFVPRGSSKTFAEMDLAEKNHFSHRKKAFDLFATFLHSLTS
jgi:XTP/dITP diphosphohydrolase